MGIRIICFCISTLDMFLYIESPFYTHLRNVRLQVLALVSQAGML